MLRGKLGELRRAVKEAGANLIACDDELLPRQERNLEQEIGLPVIDRRFKTIDFFVLFDVEALSSRARKLFFD